MPRLRRTAKRQRTGHGERTRERLLTGHDFTFLDDRPALDADELRQAWEELRDELLALHIAERPGSRPWAWWQYDAPERRQRLDGVHPFDDLIRTEHVERIARKPDTSPSFRDRAHELYFGKPACLIVPDDFEAAFESELDYLDRLGLLDYEERAACGCH